jgi:hypothetical protein
MPGWHALVNEFLRLGSRRGDRGAAPIPLTAGAKGALPFLIELAGLESSEGLLREWAAGAGEKSDVLVMDYQLRSTAMRAIRNFGPAASNAIPTLISAMQETNRWIRMSSGMTLLRIGPVAPDSIPKLLPGLTNRETAVPMLCLLADYGADAFPALPHIQQLASGRAPLREVAGNPPPMSLQAPRRYTPVPARPAMIAKVVDSGTSGEVAIGDRYLSVHRLPGVTYNRLAEDTGLKFPVPWIESPVPTRYGPRGAQVEAKLDSGVLARLTVAELASDAAREIGLAAAGTFSAQ